MKKIYILITIAIMPIVFFVPIANAYKTPTHYHLIENISHKSSPDFDLNAYLTTNLKFNQGVETQISSKEIYKWMAEGGIKEDEPYAWLGSFNIRPANHFHDPLVTNLVDAGFTGIWGTEFIDGNSALLWAQFPEMTQTGGHYSWRDARQYYLNALIATNQSDRETNFANAFRAIGQVMHLMQDMSVPEHVRDDGHYLARTYETWTNEALDDKKYPQKYAILAAALNYPYLFDIAELRKISPFSEAPVPIARLFDSEQYTGNNPDVTHTDVTHTPNIGLAEYTNANFLSGDTIFAGLFSTHFPYPSIATSVRTEDKDIADPFNPGTTVKRPYYIKIADGERGKDDLGYRLAGVDYLSFYRNETNEFENAEIVIIPPMDDYVFADYAQLLLPRAVGYSSTLLNYFFRGKMETIAVEKLDEIGNVTELLVNVQNVTTDETMKDGYFTLAYSYIKPTGWGDLHGYGTISNIPSGEIAFNGSKQLSFVLENPIPFDATDKQYTLVYAGTLGAETDAVIGKVVTVTPDAIAITAPERFVYALADDGLPNKSFAKLRMQLHDNNQTIVMTDGSVTATVRYKIHLNHTDDLANEPPDGFERSETFTTVASLPVAVALDAVNPTELEFDFSANPIPFGVTDLTLEVAYRQGDAVIAIGTKDLNEPQYVGVWNAHDRFLLDRDLNPDDSVHDWQLLTQDEIMNDPALVRRLDSDGGGLIDEIVDPVDVDIDVAFVGAPEEVLPENYQASYSHIPAGRFGRLAFIADQSPIFALFHDRYTSSLPDSSASGDYLKFDGIGRYFFPGATNQQVGETYYYTPIYLFRGIKNHFSYTSVGLFPKPINRTDEGMAIMEADWPAPASTAPVPATTIKP